VGKKSFRRTVFAAFPALVLGACAVFSGPGGSAPSAPGAEEAWSSSPPAALPAGARQYLAEISGAFSRQDGAFLLEQGEAAWNAAVRPRYDDATALALLYRAGAAAREDYAARANGLPRLDFRQIKGIEYAGWAERGPLIEVEGRLLLSGGGAVPCSLLLVWRLREPKIQGLYP
jgi:hypothetical protein